SRRGALNCMQMIFEVFCFWEASQVIEIYKLEHGGGLPLLIAFVAGALILKNIIWWIGIRLLGVNTLKNHPLSSGGCWILKILSINFFLRMFLIDFCGKKIWKKKRIGRVGRIAAFVVYLSLLTIYSSIVGG
ncbi:hypothetical protein ACJX0J_006356, partial [Zea mays]